MQLINSYDTFSHTADIFARGVQMIAVSVADTARADEELRGLVFPDPMAVLRAWATDPFKALETESGRRLNSPETLLSLVEILLTFVDELPDWAGPVLHSTAKLLEQVAREKLDTETSQLDWSVKRRLLEPIASESVRIDNELVLVPACSGDLQRQFLELALLDQRSHDIRPDGPMYTMMAEANSTWGFDEDLLDRVLEFPPVASGRPRLLTDFIAAWRGRPDRSGFCVSWYDICGLQEQRLVVRNVRDFCAEDLAWKRLNGRRNELGRQLAAEMAQRGQQRLRPGQLVTVAGIPAWGPESTEIIGYEACVSRIDEDGTVHLEKIPEIHWHADALIPKVPTGIGRWLP
jgi:hypothetical protein